MNKEELRAECSRLYKCETLKDSLDLLDIYAEFLFRAVFNHHHEKVYSYADADAKMLLQMMMTKVFHLRRNLDGIGFTSREGHKLNPIIDPTIIASLVRNIYETVGLFNLIYVHPNDDATRDLVYQLWVVSGLKYRQRFVDQAITDDAKKKVEDDKKLIDQITQEIKDSDTYKALSEDNRAKVDMRLERKEYLITIEGGNVKTHHWQKLVEIAEIQEGLLENIYGYFSQYAHPSNTAVYQFQNMFGKDDEAFKELTNFNLKIAFFMLSIFVADYIKLFPSVMKTFESMELHEQIALNYHNYFTRGDDFNINDASEALN